jgi:hypothetical protein
VAQVRASLVILGVSKIVLESQPMRFRLDLLVNCWKRIAKNVYCTLNSNLLNTAFDKLHLVHVAPTELQHSSVCGPRTGLPCRSLTSSGPAIRSCETSAKNHDKTSDSS